MLDDSSSPVATPADNVPWGPGTALLTAISVIVLSTVASYAASTITSRTGLSEIQQNTVIYFVSSLAMLSVMVGFLRVYNYKIGQLFGKLKARVPVVMTVMLGLYLVTTTIVQNYLRSLPGYQADQEQNLGIKGIAGHTKIVAFIAICVLTPIVEEMVFRGILYRGLKRRWPRILAALATSALFGAAHMQWNVAADTFVLSMFMILAYELTGTLWTNILIHAAKNTLAFVYVYVLLK